MNKLPAFASAISAKLDIAREMQNRLLCLPSSAWRVNEETPKKIGVFTGTRADYGLLRFLMQEIVDDQALELILFASGSHLSTQFGYTINAITADGFVVNESVDMLLSSDTQAATVKSLGVGLLGFADALERQKPDLVIVLAIDEALGFAQTSSLMGFP